ncbi:MAG: PadR family transcriptional regulator [Oscillospiraceae bacterium]|nr:PadR family transcriptional regulator [Oscillospiraceae bacterium]
MTKYILIGTVLERPLTGYDMKKEIEMGVGNFYKASYGSLYPALKKLTEQGMLAMTEETWGGRVKKYYVATQAGKAEFMEWLAQPDCDSPLVQIYFFDYLPAELRQKRIAEIEHKQALAIHHLEQLEKQLVAEIDLHNDYFGMSTLYYGLAVGRISLRWLAHLKEGKPLREFLGSGEL